MKEQRSPAVTWISLGVWAAVALTLARSLVLYAMDHLVRGHDLAMTRWRMAERLPRSLLWSLAVGIVAAWLFSRRPQSLTARGASILVGTALLLSALAGWPFDDAYHIPGTSTSRGQATLSALALTALAGAAILRWLVLRGTILARPRDLVLGLVLAACLPVVAHLAEMRVGPSMAVRIVVRDIVVDTSAWTAEAGEGEHAPRPGTITPDFDFRLDVGEMPALVMPPPARVGLTVPTGEGTLRLVGAAGCDLGATESAATRDAAPRLHFRVEVDGREVFVHRRTPWKDEAPSDRAWARFGGGAGIAVAPGSRVTLSVDVEHARGAAPAALTAGFGGLALVRTREVERTRASAEQPNIVLVVMDTLRADRTSAYGYSRPTTPVLERLAARGILYENAYATSSWTWPSTASILTGLDPAEHGVESDTACYLSEELVTLPEALQAQGWTTAAFSGNPLVAPSKNFGQGFERFDVAPTTFLTSDRLVPDALAWLEAHASVRFFLYLHLVDPHEIHRILGEERARFAGDPPSDMDEHALTLYADRLLAGEGHTADGGWDPSLVVPPAHAAWLKDGYDAAVAAGDLWIGRVIERVEELGLSGTTLIVFTSDHGEEFLEHGHLKHGQSLHEELVRVPLVMAGPGVPAGRRVETSVSNVDLAATVARAVGVRFGPPGAMDLLDPDGVVPRSVFTSTEYGWWRGRNGVPLRGVHEGPWSLHWLRSAPGAGLVGEAGEDDVMLFDLRVDPGELNDVAAAERARVSALIAEIRRREEGLSMRRPRSVRAGHGTLQLLQATGYAGHAR